MAMKPAGQDPATRPSGLVEPSHTTALLPPKSQSFLDHLIAGFWPTGSSNHPDAAEQSANTAHRRAPGASPAAQVLRCSGVMSRKHSRTSIADRSPKQSDRARDGRGVDAGSGVVEPVEKPDADAKCFGDQIQPACRHAVGAVLVFLHLLEGDGTDLPGEIALTEAELYAAQFDASAYVDVEPCRKGFVIVLSLVHFRCSLDANKRKARHACGGRARLHIDVQISIDRDRRPHPADMYDVPDYAGRKIQVAPLLLV